MHNRTFVLNFLSLNFALNIFDFSSEKYLSKTFFHKVMNQMMIQGYNIHCNSWWFINESLAMSNRDDSYSIFMKEGIGRIKWRISQGSTDRQIFNHCTKCGLPGGEKVFWHPIKWCHERRNQRTWWVIVHDNDSWSNDVIRAGSLRMGAKISQNFLRLNFEYLQRSAFTEDLSCTKCYLWSRETFYMHYVICNYIT